MTAPLVQKVDLAIEYHVEFTQNAFDPANKILADTLSRHEQRRHRVAVIIDSGVAAARPELTSAIARYAEHHRGQLELACAPWVIPGGEQAKCEAQVTDLHRRLAALEIDRHSYVLAIGGGAVLDVVGYAAATLHRGVRLVRMPTTVLAQNDAGVGVKNGINAFGIKNFLGTFNAPFAVINDGDFLATLDRRDQIAGMAEAIKVALIRDRNFFTWIDDHTDALTAFDAEAVAYLVRRCAELHLEHIACGGDPFEQTSVRPLDYGHWAAHKLESLTGHALRHGEAVAIGIAVDSGYSVANGLLAEHEHQRILSVLRRLNLPMWHDRLRDPGLLHGIAEFREHLGGDLCLTMLREIGSPTEIHDVANGVLTSVIERLSPGVR